MKWTDWRSNDTGRWRININMRCIEIILPELQECRCLWLTLTWDVLKSITSKLLLIFSPININMRCIEMKTPVHRTSQTFWLTLTWDVLKFCRIERVVLFYLRLTLTWDVLKLLIKHCFLLRSVININMRCIEIQQYK